jgi:ArsR family metal-binding transcriptional regulator
MALIAAFPKRSEFEKARSVLARLKLPHRVVSPDPGYSLVGAPALECDPDGLSAIQEAIQDGSDIICSGWTEYQTSSVAVPENPPAHFDEDVFLEALIMFFGPCMADESRIRLIAHLAGDVAAALPYVNATMPNASFNAGPCTLTYMDGHRMVSVSPRRVAIGKADDLVDGWRTLERIRIIVNQAWARRAAIVPSFELRARPPALEIYKRLPRTNCKACGEETCMAFAVSLWQGTAQPAQCTPVFTDQYAALRAALLEICRGLGIPSEVSGGL